MFRIITGINCICSVKGDNHYFKVKDSDRSVSRHPDRSGGFIHLSVRPGASISMILIGL